MAQVEMGSTCCPQTGFEEITGDVPERDFWAESQNFCQALGERVQLPRTPLERHSATIETRMITTICGFRLQNVINLVQKDVQK
jgi:hypothetical protein